MSQEQQKQGGQGTSLAPLSLSTYLPTYLGTYLGTFVVTQCLCECLHLPHTQDSLHHPYRKANS